MKSFVRAQCAPRSGRSRCLVAADPRGHSTAVTDVPLFKPTTTTQPLLLAQRNENPGGGMFRNENPGGGMYKKSKKKKSDSSEIKAPSTRAS